MNELNKLRENILSVKESQKELTQKEIQRVIDAIVKESKNYKVNNDCSLKFQFSTNLTNKDFAELSLKLYNENKIFIERTKLEVSSGMGIYDNGRTYLADAIKVSFID